jgi:ADP-heptose:LPS heptosyltransferase
MILFIKLDAMGDVLRSACLLPVILEKHTAPYIAWLTKQDSVELVSMMKNVDEVIELSESGMARILATPWDHVYSLSNDLTSASIATIVRANHRPVGYYLQDGIIKSSNSAAELWLQMAAFDRLKKENKKSYQHHMLAILTDQIQPINPPAISLRDETRASASKRVSALFPDSGRRRVAINVGAGGRWPKKMLTAEQIYQYFLLLVQKLDVDVLLVGGRAENDKVNAILGLGSATPRLRAAVTDISVTEFAAILNETDALLCGDTLAMHIAAAIGLPTVAVFGPTSSSEIFDFDGLITKVWTPYLDCLVCYGDCTKKENCMSLLDLSYLVQLTEEQLNQPRRELLT